MNVTNPENALIFGTARTLLLEHPTNLVLCLDVESATSTASLHAIHSALKHLNAVLDLKQVDAEYVERGGVYHISRIISDDAINEAARGSIEGMELVDEVIGNHKSTIRLISERPGTLDTLVYQQFADEPNLGENEVEVEVHATALNFKVCFYIPVPADLKKL
jgi:hypothetical protein